MSFSQKLFHFFSKVLNGKNLHLVKSLPYYKQGKTHSANRLDYIRQSTLELISKEIYTNKIKGNVAELGVYQGDFAKDINTHFSDRMIYLFDTFKGFDTRDIKEEKNLGFSDGSQKFDNTSIELVLSKLPNKEKAIIKQGFFPDTAVDLEDTFCFVSIDTDLYKPVYEGLKYFYPRLSNGGYIFIHDYNNEQYEGAKQAVKQFCTEHKISFTPIADIGGTAIICK